MGKRDSYESGQFCWVELGSSDPNSAREFYASVMEWDTEQSSFTGGTYTTCQIGASAVAGIYGAVSGLPSAWMSYVSVTNVDTLTAQVEALGGKIITTPSDANELGRMSVVADPLGAVFALWQPKQLAGAQLVNDEGAFCLTQLNTRDSEVAFEFYSQLFGWNIVRQSSEVPYWGVYVNDRLNAGMMASAGPDHWLVYFTAPSLETSIERIEASGGKVSVHPMEIAGGRICIASDPQGAVFGLFEGHVDD